jgi:hypothetical protein
VFDGKTPVTYPPRSASDASRVLASVRAELPLGAFRTVENDLSGIVVSQPRLPALLVGRPPAGLALAAASDQRDLPGIHRVGV